MRYLGRKLGYYPSDPDAAHKVEILSCSFYETYEQIGKTFRIKDETAKAKEVKKLFDKVLPDFLKSINKECKKDFLTGKSLTVADFLIGGVMYCSILDN